MPMVTIYPISGRQLGPLSIPHRWCEECDLTINLVRRIAEEPGREDVQVKVKPWIRHIFDALRRGGWHAPVVAIDGKGFSQGSVPDADELRERLDAAAATE